MEHYVVIKNNDAVVRLAWNIPKTVEVKTRDSDDSILPASHITRNVNGKASLPGLEGCHTK